MLKKIALITILLFTVFISSTANAQIDASSQLPELNPFCWHRVDCHKIRKQFMTNAPSCEGDPACKELEEGFIKDASVAPCTGGTGAEQWGRCLPAGKSKTEISFGGKPEFANVGEFIVLMYKYLLTIASIVAVVVVIIAGAQWITSGGNSEAIGSAKKRIGGALIGLFIAYMSYFVLNTINPALVNLRLPQVWLVKPQALVPEFCSDLDPNGTGKPKFMFAADLNNQTAPVTLETAAGKADGFNFTKPDSTFNFYCGNRFFAEGGGKSTCMGSFCGTGGKKDGTACFDKKGDRKSYVCGDVRISGSISYSSIVKGCGFWVGTVGQVTGIPAPWGCPPVKAVRLLTVCEESVGDGNTESIDEDLRFGTGSVDSTNGRYWIESKAADVLSDVMNLCKKYGWGEVKGFVVKFGMEVDISPKVPVHYIGKNGVDLGSYGSGAFKNLYKVDKIHLFKLDDILKGARMNVDVADIEDTDKVTDKNKSYWESQYPK